MSHQLPELPEPIDYQFQHEDTGLISTVDGQQVEWGFEKNNPRWQRIGGSYSESQMRAYAELAIASVKREPLNIPEGWKIVPIVATEEMCREGDDCQEYDPRMDESESYYTWTAMINAAPPPPVTAATASKRDGE